MCPRSSKSLELKHFGVAADGVGFFALDGVQPLQENQFENMAFVVVDNPKATERLTEEEFRKLVCEDWNWKVMRLTETDFSLIFPNADSLRLCRNAMDLTLPISKMRVIILDEIQHPMRSVPGLSEVWVRLRGLPAILLEPSRLLAATTMIAKPLHVDELSLVKEPSGVLMKFATPVPQKMRMSVVLYVNGVGAKVEVVPEDPKSGFAEPQPPPPPPWGPDDKDDQEDEEDNDTELTGSDAHWKHRKSSSAAATLPPKEQPPNVPRTGRQKTMAHKTKLTKRKISFPRGKPPKMAKFASAPAACPASPVLSTPMAVSSKLPKFNEYGSNLTCSPTFAAKLAAAASPAPPSPPSKKTISLVSVSSQDEGEEVCNFTAEKASKLSEAERQEIGWESPDEWEFKNETLAERCMNLNLRRPFEKLSDAKKKALMQEPPVYPAVPK
jgi:hypothetical protein